MPDETATVTTRSDAPSADDSLFGDAAEDTAAAVVEEETPKEGTEQDLQGSDDAGEQADPAGGPEGHRVHQGRQGHHRGAPAIVRPVHRVLR